MYGSIIRIRAKALQLLEQHPQGIRWTDLNTMIQRSDPTLHPKTINGCVWKLIDTFPEKVHKPSKGVFQLKKYATINLPSYDYLADTPNCDNT